MGAAGSPEQPSQPQESQEYTAPDGSAKDEIAVSVTDTDPGSPGQSQEDTNPGAPRVDGAQPIDEPIIRTPEEAYSLAKERPELAETMAVTAKDEIDERRAFKEGIIAQKEKNHVPEMHIRRDRERLAGLDQEADRIEFWAAVTTLHPMSESYWRANLPNYPLAWKQPILMEHLEKEIARLEEDVSIHSPGELAGFKDRGGLGSHRPGWEQDMQQRVGKDLSDIARFRQILQDVITGNASNEITA
jgi:hypothetical protein